MTSVKAKQPAETVLSYKKKSWLYYFRRDWQLYALMLLPLIFLLVFKYGSYFGLVIAFKDYKVALGFAKSDWCGFKVFQKIFALREFGKAVRNTLLLNILDLVFGFPMPVILALVLNEIKWKPFKNVNQTLLYLPHFLSWVIIGSVAIQMFSLDSGVINNVLQGWGFGAVPFLQEDTWWLISYVFIGVWQSMGWGTILYLAAISGIGQDMYEAAMLDGANRWQRCIYITVPSIKSTIVTLLIMNLGRMMSGSFERIYALMNAKCTEYTTTLAVLAYRWGIQSGKFSESTALGLFQSVIGVVLVIAADKIAKKLGEDGLF